MNLSQTLRVRVWRSKLRGEQGLFFSYFFFKAMDDNTNNERLLSRKELASFLKVSLPTVTQYVKDGCPIISKSRKVTGKGSRYCFEQGEVMRWLRNRTRALRR